MAKTGEKIIQHHEWLMIMADTYPTTSSSNNTDHDGSICSSSDDDDASSKSNGPLFELSELMTHLPIKRGLSKHYEGKSQSFTSLAGIMNIEDVAKKGRYVPHRRKIIKASKSFGNGLDAHKPYTLPKPIISKKIPRTCLSSLTFPGCDRSPNFLTTSRPPPVPPVQKKF